VKSPVGEGHPPTEATSPSSGVTLRPRRTRTPSPARCSGLAATWSTKFSLFFDNFFFYRNHIYFIN
jgi:hypothetical protein